MVCKTMGSRICATTGMSSTSEERNDFLNEQELRENDCLIHNLHVRTCKARFACILHLALCSSRGFQAQDAPHHGRYAPGGQLCGEMVVVVPLVPQRLISMVLSTMKVPQLQFLNEVIDVSGTQVVQVLPSRLPVVCNDRCPSYVPQLQFTNIFVYTPVVARSFIPMVWQTIEIPLLPYTRWSMSLFCRSFEFHSCLL